MSEPVSELRHAARGCFNAVKLCAAALELPGSPEEQIEFIDEIIQSSDKLGGLMDELQSAYDRRGPNHLPRAN